MKYFHPFIKPFTRTSVLILGTLLAGLTLYAIFARSPAVAWEGLGGGVALFFEILPNLVLGFLLAGMAQELLPRDWVVKYAGEDSGWKGYLLATGIGACTPGGPFFQFPLVAALWKAGAGVGQITAYITSWALLGFQRIIVYEGPMMGWRYASARAVTNLIAPPILGYMTGWLYQTLHGAGPS
jgi:uncharacterized membrane protein YraQ (UPF0718 family)